MPAAAKEAPFLIAKEAIVVTVGARAPVYERRIVRDKKTGLFAEVELNEFDPIDPGDEGTAHAFKPGERVNRDHPAVLDCPSGFREPYPSEL